jgi:hypothetical protein
VCPNSVLVMNRSRAPQKYHGKKIAKLKGELKDIDLAIVDFERLEAKSPAKCKPNARQRREHDSDEGANGKTLKEPMHIRTPPVAYYSICGKRTQVV